MPKLDKEALKETGLVAEEVTNDKVMTDGKIPPSGSHVEKVTKSSKFSALKQEKIADVVTGKGGDSVAIAPGIASRSIGSYGGDAVHIAGSLAAQPKSNGGTRGTSRFGKKIDPISRAINDLGTEQVVVEVKGSVPLNESADKVQGYSGRKMNDQIVRQKVVGVTPSSSQFQRSVDEIIREELVFGVGQNVKHRDQDYFDIPNKTVDSVDGTISADKDLGERGNYVPINLKVVIDTTGDIEEFVVTEHDITSYHTNNIVLDASAQHAKLHSNNIELIRREMEMKSADESVNGWSPLSRSILQPKQVLSYLKDLEQDTGNHAYAANRFAKMALSYQINRAGKDGSDPQMGMVEALLMSSLGYRPTSYYVANGLTSVSDALTTEYNESGSAALLIQAFDSLRKYNTKADVLAQPRSLKMHVAVGNNHLDGLKANPILINYLKNNQMFSTIDSEYDGVKPVMFNSAYRIVSPISWAKTFTVKTSDPTLAYSETGFRYSYDDTRNRYVTTVRHPLLDGVYKWFSINAASLRSGRGTAKNKKLTLNIPIEYMVNGLSAWQFIVNSAMSLIKESRMIAFRDLIKYSDDHSYPFTDLIDISSSMTTDAVNFTFSSIDEPLQVKVARKESAISWKMPELFWPFDETSSGEMKVILPWYLGEDLLTKQGANYKLNEDIRTMNFPIIRSGNVMQGLLDLHEIGERDVRLLFDIMVMPYYHTISAEGLAVYKYDRTESGLIAIDESIEGVFTYDNFLKQPRELGVRVVLPRGYITPDLIRIADFDTAIVRKPGYVAKYYYLADKDKNEQTEYVLNEVFTQTIGVGGLYVQQWDYIRAGDTSTYNNNGLNLGIPMILSTPDNIDALGGDADTTAANIIAGRSRFTPFITFNSSNGTPIYNKSHSDYQLVSFHSYYWFRAQILPFVINPFDLGIYSRSLNEDATKFDIFDFAYTFGLAGFRMSDFSEDQYLRSEKDLYEGHTYTEDRYLIDSKLLG